MSKYVPEGISPLPWIDSSTGRVCCTKWEVISNFGVGVVHHPRSAQNATYAVHAANTLPRALELLERMMDAWDCYCAQTVDGDRPCGKCCTRALLDECREAAQ